METVSLLFFVLSLLVAGFIVTQTIRRDIKARRNVSVVLRRDPARARAHATPRAFHSHSLQHHAHKSPPRPL